MQAGKVLPESVSFPPPGTATGQLASPFSFRAFFASCDRYDTNPSSHAHEFREKFRIEVFLNTRCAFISCKVH